MRVLQRHSPRLPDPTNTHRVPRFQISVSESKALDFLGAAGWGGLTEAGVGGRSRDRRIRSVMAATCPPSRVLSDAVDPQDVSSRHVKALCVFDYSFIAVGRTCGWARNSKHGGARGKTPAAFRAFGEGWRANQDAALVLCIKPTLSPPIPHT
jgi:hypothetical protein